MILRFAGELSNDSSVLAKPGGNNLASASTTLTIRDSSGALPLCYERERGHVQFRVAEVSQAPTPMACIGDSATLTGCDSRVTSR
jgi:hypothetical protein